VASSPIRRVLSVVGKDKLFLASALALVLTTAWRRHLPHYSLGDLRVLLALASFLVVMKGLSDSQSLRFLALRVRSHRCVPQKLVLFTALLAALATNDVALLTMVPLTLAMEADGAALMITLEAVVANGASAVSPFGSPQNIFLYFYYHLHPVEFVSALWPLAAMTVLFVLALSWLVPAPCRHIEPIEVEVDRPAAIAYGLLFVAVVLTILRLLPAPVLLAPLVYALLADRSALRIDYGLLLTFVAFFGFTDNVRHIIGTPAHAPVHVFASSALASQVISNVPAALLFADFTDHWRALLWGVSVGGFGTLIGSLANVIAYRLYRSVHASSRRFLVTLHIVNFAAFALGAALYLLLLPG